jgi:hypothetical protein
MWFKIKAYFQVLLWELGIETEQNQNFFRDTDGKVYGAYSINPKILGFWQCSRCQIIQWPMSPEIAPEETSRWYWHTEAEIWMHLCRGDAPENQEYFAPCERPIGVSDEAREEKISDAK